MSKELTLKGTGYVGHEYEGELVVDAYRSFDGDLILSITTDSWHKRVETAYLTPKKVRKLQKALTRYLEERA